MNQPHTKLKQVKGRFDEDTPVELALAIHVRNALDGFIEQYLSDREAGVLRSIRGVAMVNFTGGVGGKFVLDMRLLPANEVEEDELFKMVDAHVKEMVNGQEPL